MNGILFQFFRILGQIFGDIKIDNNGFDVITDTGLADFTQGITFGFGKIPTEKNEKRENIHE